MLRISPSVDQSVNSTLLKGGTQNILQKRGRFPPVSIRVKPLDPSLAIFYLDRFLTYQFRSSLVIPVDTFQFDFINPESEEPFSKRVFEGDNITLYANNQHIASGIIDTIEIEVDSNTGEKVRVTGRDLMCQFEDQDAVNIFQDPIPPNQYTVDTVIKLLAQNTRILNTILHRGSPPSPKRFATQPGESKLAALQRYLEPLNCIAWMSPGGQIIIGKPGFLNPQPKGRLYLRKSDRTANVISMRVVRSSATIPNIVSPIWTAQEFLQSKVPKQQTFYNPAKGPDRLRKLGHYIPKAIVTSDPQGGDPQDLAAVQDFQEQIKLAKNTQPGFGNMLNGYAKRELARVNREEIMVQVQVAGHYNEDGSPFLTDTVYTIDFDRGGVHEDMVLYQADYALTESTGQTTNLYFTRKGTIVPDQLIK